MNIPPPFNETGEPLALVGEAGVTMEIDFPAAGDGVGPLGFNFPTNACPYPIDQQPVDGLDEVPVEVTNISFLAESGDPTLGDVTVLVRDNAASGHVFCDQSTRGVITESANTASGRVDIDPYSAGGSGTMYLKLFIEAHADVFGTPTTLHHDVPVILAGPISSDPPGPGDVFTYQPTAETVAILADNDALFFGIAITLDDVSIEPNPAPGTCVVPAR